MTQLLTNEHEVKYLMQWWMNVILNNPWIQWSVSNEWMSPPPPPNWSDMTDHLLEVLSYSFFTSHVSLREALPSQEEESTWPQTKTHPREQSTMCVWRMVNLLWRWLLTQNGSGKETAPPSLGVNTLLIRYVPKPLGAEWLEKKNYNKNGFIKSITNNW